MMRHFQENESEKKGFWDIPAGRNILTFRWVFLILLVPLSFVAGNVFEYENVFIKFYAGSLIYNGLVTWFILWKYDEFRKMPDFIYYIDAILITGLVFFLGGIRTDIYLLYFFLIAYYGINRNIRGTIQISISCMSMYTVAALVANMSFQLYWIFQLFIRDIMFVVSAYGVILILVKVKKYDEMHKKEFRKARTDKLTGLPNRHYLEQKLEEEITNCDETNKVMNVLVFDLDNFKSFNDSYGHGWGDRLLELFARIITNGIRKADIPVRYGGEEFLLLVKDADFETAISVGNRIRRELEKQKIHVGEGDAKRRVTVSCGVAQYPTHADNIKDVIEKADQSLYYAKEHGKNRVVGYDELLKIQELDEVM